ncbi:hypothetical protein [Alkalihalobacillus sp. LMS39]|uniref:hypothetical protein n=1 Tax=Alkalihalobacillus sp. LMS39 TaxID=2924032 RepID=UPI001FB305CF|nr:hypothetical protein [Alkalihalobacillus sp. LMS39]UOE92603.1 hypothetical protein MM271_15330 [Alkalihalobacillus sp. LMS39]
MKVKIKYIPLMIVILLLLSIGYAVYFVDSEQTSTTVETLGDFGSYVERHHPEFEYSLHILLDEYKFSNVDGLGSLVTDLSNERNYLAISNNPNEETLEQLKKETETSLEEYVTNMKHVDPATLPYAQLKNAWFYTTGQMENQNDIHLHTLGLTIDDEHFIVQISYTTAYPEYKTEAKKLFLMANSLKYKQNIED